MSKSAELSGLKVDKFLDKFRKRRLIRSGGPTSSKKAEEEFQTATVQGRLPARIESVVWLDGMMEV